MYEIEFSGYDAVHEESFIYDMPSGHNCYLFVLFKSKAEVEVEKELCVVEPNTAILYEPRTPIYYRAYKEVYKNDWIRFETDESLVIQFPQKNIPFPVADSEYCQNLIKLLTWESAFSTSAGEANIKNLMRVLFSKLYDSINNTTNYHAGELLNLHKMIFSNPQLHWNVSQMAKDLHLSSGYLQMIYKDMFGVSCMDDVIESRIRLAQDYLISTAKSVSQIADDCGYNNVEHFCRQFKKVIGCTPGNYRKQYTEEKKSQVSQHMTLGGNSV